MGLEDVRARLRDRQLKDGARGTDEVWICLDVELAAELETLQSELQLAQRQEQEQPVGKPRLGGRPAAADGSGPDPAITDLEQRIEAKEHEVRSASLRLVFRSISSTMYQQVLNAHPDQDETEGQADFFNALCEECLREVWDVSGRVEGLGWSEIAAELSYGEWEQTALRVLALNRRKVDVPFSLRPSKQKPS